jgi:hypothetical protein
MNTKTIISGSLLIGLLFGILSCQNGTKNTEKVSDTIAVVQDTIQSAVIEKNVEVIPFPENVEILLPTQYRKESTGYPQNVKGKDWYELYKDSKTGKWCIAKADLQISYGHDECAAEDVMVIKSQHEDAVLFFTSFDRLSDNIETILENKPLIPGIPVDFKMNAKNYSLSASGTLYDDEGKTIAAAQLPKDSEGNIYIPQIKKFNLSFSSDNAKSYSIAGIESINSTNPKIIWVGDLNDDGLPDMILDLSDLYESEHLYFFLSDKNDFEKPLKKIADLLVVNDC